MWGLIPLNTMTSQIQNIFLVVLILKGKTEVIYPLPVLYKLIVGRLKYSGLPGMENPLSGAANRALTAASDI